MELEVGRIYVLLNGEDAFNLYEPGEKPLLVKAVGPADEYGVVPVSTIEYRYGDNEYGVSPVLTTKHCDAFPLQQYVKVDGLKPASEKQRAAFNREYRKVVNNFNKKGNNTSWLLD